MRTIETKKISVSFTPEMLEKIENYAKKIGIPRATAVCVLVAKAFEQEEMVNAVNDFSKFYNNGFGDDLEDMKKALEDLKEDGNRK